MANDDVVGDDSLSALPSRAASELRSAVALLREALGQRASVDWAGDGANSVARPNLLTVRWTDQDGPPRRLRLVPWADTPRDAGDDAAAEDGDAILVLPRTRRTLRANLHADLRARGASFVDLRGAVHLTLPWALIDRTDLRAAQQTSIASALPADPFADRGSLVVRTLFAGDPGRAWQVRHLAVAAGVGASTASEVLTALEARQLVTIARQGRTAQVRLADPVRVLDAWTRVYDWHRNRHIVVHAPIGDPARFVNRLPQLMHPRYRWALTMQAGASLVAPHAAWDRVHVYVDVPAPDRRDWRHALASVAARAGWSSGPDGRLVLMAPYYATSAWHGLRTVRGLPVVSDLQLALDLWHYPLRGREQAEHLVEQLLRPRAALGGPPVAADAPATHG